MKLVFLVFSLLIFASCGQTSGDSSVNSTFREICNLNVTDDSCAVDTVDDRYGIDLLEAAIEVPIKIQNDEIIFLDNKSFLSTGARIKCGITVNNGEVYRFTFKADKLTIKTKSEIYEMDKISEGNDLNGTWVSKESKDLGVFVIRTLAIINSSRAVIRKSCES
jgi:hypothetical protein